MITIVHIVNQFFAGLGGEEKAGLPVNVIEGAAGAARALEMKLGAEAGISCTIYVGDNYFHEHKDEAIAAILDAVRASGPQVLVAGPAFNSGRYGMTCVEVCSAVAGEFAIPCVTAMHEENPGVDAYREVADPRLYCLPTTETTAGMNDAMTGLARIALRLARGEAIGSAAKEGYISRGIRGIEKTEQRGAARAVEMLLKKINHQSFTSELPLEVWDDAPPAPPLEHVKDRNIAVVTTSGVVPYGNPDKFKTYRNTYWRKYNVAELKELEPGKWEAVHGGYNVAYMNQNPHYGVPLDALRALEAEGAIGAGKLYPAYYVIPGNQGSPTVMRRMGQEIAADLKKDNVEGVLFVATWGTCSRSGAVISKELEKAGLPVALISAMFPVAQQVRANRIVKGVSIPHPCGDPSLPKELDARLRREIIQTALRALESEVTGPTVFSPPVAMGG